MKIEHLSSVRSVEKLENTGFECSNIRYFYIEKRRQELHKLINHYGGIADHDEIVKISQKFDDELIELYKRKKA